MTLLKIMMPVVLVNAIILVVVPSITTAQTTIRIDGSSTVGPIVDAFVEHSTKTLPDVKFSIKKTGSGDGAMALIEGRCEVATMNRFMKPDEYKRMVDTGKMPTPFASSRTVCSRQLVSVT